MEHNIDEQIHILEQKAENLQNSVNKKYIFLLGNFLITFFNLKKGKYIECVKIMEEILNLKKTSLGENNEEVRKKLFFHLFFSYLNSILNQLIKYVSYAI